jgi:NADPH:quinone reductase
MVPTSVRMVSFEAPGEPEVLTVREQPLPPLGSGEVRIAVQLAGVSYPDLLLRSGRLPSQRLPCTPGYEIAGTVQTLGPEVADLAVGARVIAMLAGGGGYATSAVVDARAVEVVPDAMEMEVALALGITGRTAFLLLQRAGLMPGEAVFIPAALGGVGSLAVQVAKSQGARVIAGVGAEGKRERTRGLGADLPVSYADGTWVDEVKQFTGGRGADVVFQSTGGRLGAESLRALAPLGRLVLFGADNVVSPEPLSAETVRSLIAQGQTLSGFSLMRLPETARREAFAELARLVATGRVSPLVERYPLEDAARAHRDIEERRTAGKVILETGIR